MKKIIRFFSFIICFLSIVVLSLHYTSGTSNERPCIKPQDSYSPQDSYIRFLADSFIPDSGKINYFISDGKYKDCVLSEDALISEIGNDPNLSNREKEDIIYQIESHSKKFVFPSDPYYRLRERLAKKYSVSSTGELFPSAGLFGIYWGFNKVLQIGMLSLLLSIFCFVCSFFLPTKKATVNKDQSQKQRNENEDEHK